MTRINVTFDDLRDSDQVAMKHLAAAMIKGLEIAIAPDEPNPPSIMGTFVMVMASALMERGATVDQLEWATDAAILRLRRQQMKGVNDG